MLGRAKRTPSLRYILVALAAALAGDTGGSCLCATKSSCFFILWPVTVFSAQHGIAFFLKLRPYVEATELINGHCGEQRSIRLFARRRRQQMQTERNPRLRQQDP